MIEKLGIIAEENNLDVLIISAPDNLEYFINVPSLGDITALLIYSRVDNNAALYVPLLEYQRYRDQAPQYIEIYGVSKTIKPGDMPIVDLDWKQIIEKHSGNKKIGSDLSHVSPLQRTITQVLGDRVVDISNHIWKKRMIKSKEEIKAIQEAIRVTIKGIYAVTAGIRDNITETELTGLFEKTVRDNGVERFAFDPIIAFKPNNAYPHTTPTTRSIGTRDLILVDVGVRVKNRCSDITRMIIRGRPSPDERKHIQAVSEAVEASIDHIKPGVKASEVYEAAARTLEKYGLRDRFIHGLGHGIGIVVHEPPYLRAGSDTILEPGMVFTIEPGVYIPGKHGVRIEEVVLVTEKGCKVLSSKLDKVLVST